MSQLHHLCRLEAKISLKIMEVLLWVANNPAPRVCFVEKRDPEELLDFFLENEDRVCLIEKINDYPFFISEDYDKPILVISEDASTEPIIYYNLDGTTRREYFVEIAGVCPKKDSFFQHFMWYVSFY